MTKRHIIPFILVVGFFTSCSAPQYKADLYEKAAAIQQQQKVSEHPLSSPINLTSSSKNLASNLPPLETLEYSVRYLGLPIATITAAIKESIIYQGRKVYVFELLGQSRPFWAKIFKIDDRYIAYMDVEHLHSLRQEEYRREGRYQRDAIIEYDQTAHTATSRHLLNGTEKTFTIPPDVHDALSAVYYFRMQPLQVGSVIDYNVNVSEKNYNLLGVIEKETTISLKGFGRVPALVFQPYVELGGEDIKKGKVKGYFSTDARHIPLKAEVKTPLFGKATVTLKSVNGKKAL